MPATREQADAMMRQAKKLIRSSAYYDTTDPDHPQVQATVRKLFEASTPVLTQPKPAPAPSRDAQILAQAKDLMAHPSYEDRAHPNHAETRRHVEAAFAAVYGDK